MMRQARRLAWLAAAATWTGSVCKTTYARKFDLGAAQISRDVQQFLKLARARGLDLQARKLGVITTPELIPSDPLFADAPEPTVILADVLGRNFAKVEVVERKAPHAPTLRAVVRAITEGRALQFLYFSTTSGPRRRTAYPHAVIHADGRMHIRAFQPGKGYRDFVLGRMQNVVLGDKPLPDPNLVRANDTDWHTVFVIILRVRHENRAVAEALAAEIGADPATLTRRIPVRKALLDYTLPFYKGGRYERDFHLDVQVCATDCGAPDRR